MRGFNQTAGDGVGRRLRTALEESLATPGFVWFVAFTVAALIYGAHRAYIVRWLCDDIFITFRYAENFLGGHGFVYNISERVEGYTHFAWLCLLTFLQWLGLGPEAASQWVGEVCFVLTLGLFAVISYRIAGKEGLLGPVATAALALHFDFHVWATSGLETSFFTLLVSLGFFVMCFSRVQARVRYVLAGLFFTLGVMTRPDGIIFLGLALAFEVVVLWLKKTPLKTIGAMSAWFLLPFVLLVLPYAVWKISYYGDFLPNTFYAKSGTLSYFDQGFFYIWTYLRGYPSSWLFLLAVPYLAVEWRRAGAGRFADRVRVLVQNEQSRSVMLALLFIVIYAIVFVAKVGGDFMYARFISPLIPLLYFVTEVGFRKLLVSRPDLLKACIAALLVLIVTDKTTRDDYLTDNGGHGPAKTDGLSGIGDERWFWTHDLGHEVSLMRLQTIQGRMMRTFFEGEDVTVVLRGQNNFAYYGKFRTCIENAGLTDKYIAHLPVTKRGRPGHEREAPWEYLIQRRTNFLFFRTPQQDSSSFRKIRFTYPVDSLSGYMCTYDPALLRRLDERFPGRIVYVKFENYLDDYVRSMGSRSRQQVELDYKNFQDFYFRGVQDPAREQPFLAYLRSR